MDQSRSHRNHDRSTKFSDDKFTINQLEKKNEK